MKKHKKRKNSALLYEVLIEELAKSCKNKDFVKRDQLNSLLKEFFLKNSLLRADLKLYKEILDVSNVDERTAEKILDDIKQRKKEINEVELSTLQNQLVSELKKINENILSNFVSDYKTLATIAQIFSSNTSSKNKVLLEENIISKMTNRSQEREMVPLDDLTLKSFIERFNSEYACLRTEQKELLAKYIMSFDDNAIDLKIHVNNEIGRIKKELNENISKEQFQEDEKLLENAKRVLIILEEYKDKPLNFKLIRQILKIQDLLQEMNK